MAEKKWIAWVAVIALIVAVVALVIILNNGITGNTIKVQQSNSGGTDVYTRAEIDTLIKNMSNTLTVNNSKACSADGICEVQSIQIPNVLNIWSGGIRQPSGTWVTSSLSTGLLNITSLSGSGNAYVCVNSQGTVFRSITPCA